MCGVITSESFMVPMFWFHFFELWLINRPPKYYLELKSITLSFQQKAINSAPSLKICQTADYLQYASPWGKMPETLNNIF